MSELNDVCDKIFIISSRLSDFAIKMSRIVYIELVCIIMRKVYKLVVFNMHFSI